MAEAGQKSKWPFVFKAISFLVGAGLMIVGILDILSLNLNDPITIVLPVYYV